MWDLDWDDAGVANQDPQQQLIASLNDQLSEQGAELRKLRTELASKSNTLNLMHQALKPIREELQPHLTPKESASAVAILQAVPMHFQRLHEQANANATPEAVAKETKAENAKLREGLHAAKLQSHYLEMIVVPMLTKALIQYNSNAQGLANDVAHELEPAMNSFNGQKFFSKTLPGLVAATKQFQGTTNTVKSLNKQLAASPGLADSYLIVQHLKEDPKIDGNKVFWDSLKRRVKETHRVRAKLLKWLPEEHTDSQRQYISSNLAAIIEANKMANPDLDKLPSQLQWMIDISHLAHFPIVIEPPNTSQPIPESTLQPEETSTRDEKIDASLSGNERAHLV